MPTLCLGEAIVDLVCERHVEGLADADSFRPHFGGAVANVALTAAALGASVRLAGGAGNDAWGHWVRDRLEAAGVGLQHFTLVEGCATPVAFVVNDREGEPSFQIYGQGIAATLEAVADQLPAAVDAADALFLSSNTLAGESERELTMAARERALERGLPVLFDPNLRLHRWRTAAAAVAEANACLPGTLLVRCNRAEAQLMTGESDPERSALALIKSGARMAVITLGADGALLRGEVRADAAGRPAKVASTMGAGDVLTGVLLARLALAGFYPPAAAAGGGGGGPGGGPAAPRATERWGAHE